MAVTRNTLLPLSVITSAMEGNNDALIRVRNHYVGFIRSLSMCRITDSDGIDHFRIVLYLEKESPETWTAYNKRIHSVCAVPVDAPRPLLSERSTSAGAEQLNSSTHDNDTPSQP